MSTAQTYNILDLYTFGFLSRQQYPLHPCPLLLTAKDYQNKAQQCLAIVWEQCQVAVACGGGMVDM
jgi:hypothetical protein